MGLHETECFWMILTRMPLESTLSTMVSTSIPGFRERRSNAVPLARAEATSDGSADRVTVRAAAFTIYSTGKQHRWGIEDIIRRSRIQKRRS